MLHTINEILAEHRLLHENLHTLLHLATAIRSASGEQSADNPASAPQQLCAQMEVVQQTLRAHFEREEATLENIVRFGGHPEAMASLTELWHEHMQLNADMESLRQTASAAGASNREPADIESLLESEIHSLDAKLAAHTRREGLLFAKVKALLGAQ